MQENDRLLPTLLIILLLTNCTSINDASEKDSGIAIQKEYPLIVSDLSKKAFGYVHSYASLTNSAGKDAISIDLPQQGLIDLVLVLNYEGRPIMATRPFGGKVLRATHQNTALTLVSLYVIPFRKEPEQNVLNHIRSHPGFDELVSRVSVIAETNISFLDDVPTKNMVRDILNTLFEETRENVSTEMSSAMNVDVEPNHVASVFNRTKLPLNTRILNIVQSETVFDQILNGYQLDSEPVYRNALSSGNFEVQNGSYRIGIGSTPETSTLKTRKLTRDILFKLHTVFGISNDDSERFEELFDEIAGDLLLKQSLPKENAIIYAQELINMHADQFSNYAKRLLTDAEVNANHISLFTEVAFNVLKSQGTRAPVFSDDDFYTQWENLHDFDRSSTICVENSTEVDCSVRISPIQHAMASNKCFANEQEITFSSNVYAPFGLDTKSKVRIDWEFLPRGAAGFWIIDIPNSKERVSSQIKTTGCFDFGNQEQVRITQYVTDHDGRKSNSEFIHIPRPKSKIGFLSNPGNVRGAKQFTIE